MSMRPSLALSALSILAAAALLGACSSSDTGGGGTTTSSGSGDACHDYAGWDGSAPAVAFAADVLPIFQISCSLSASCHGSETGTGGRPYLGTKKDVVPTPEQLDLIFTQNVGVASTKEPSRLLVDPGHPETSFLMEKMDGTLLCPTLPCATGDKCGDSMPQGSPVLSADKRDVVRRWIFQGAKND